MSPVRAVVARAGKSNRLDDVVCVPEVNHNAGQPFPPMDIAAAIGRSPGRSTFHLLLSSSFKYSLTVGSYKSDRIALTGRSEGRTPPPGSARDSRSPPRPASDPGAAAEKAAPGSRRRGYCGLNWPPPRPTLQKSLSLLEKTFFDWRTPLAWNTSMPHATNEVGV